VGERAAPIVRTPSVPTWGSTAHFAYCVNGHGYGQVNENGLCLRRCLKSRKVRRQMGIRKEALAGLRNRSTVGAK
jgi:hypothetical protein